MFAYLLSEPFRAELHAGLHTLGVVMAVSILGKLWMQGLSAGPLRYVIQRFLVLSVYTFAASILIYMLRSLRLYEQVILLLVELFVLGLVDTDTHHVETTSPNDIHSQLFQEDVIDGVDDACSASPNGDVVQTLARILAWWHNIADVQTWHPSNVRIEAMAVSALMTVVGVAVMYVKDVALQFKHLREDVSAKEQHPASLLAIFTLSMAGAFASSVITIAAIGLGVFAAGVLSSLSLLPFKWALAHLRGAGAVRAAERCGSRVASFLLVAVVAVAWCGAMLLWYAVKVALKALQLSVALALVVYHAAGGLARQAWRPALLAGQLLGLSSSSLASLGKSLPARWAAYRKQRREASERLLQETARTAAAAANPRAAAAAAVQEGRPQQQQQRGSKGKKGKAGFRTAAAPPARSAPPTPQPAAPAPAPAAPPTPAAAAAPAEPRPSPVGSNSRGKKNKSRATAAPAAAAATPFAPQPSSSSAPRPASLPRQPSSDPPAQHPPLDRASSSSSSGGGGSGSRNKPSRSASRPAPAIVLQPPAAPEPTAPAQPQQPPATPPQPSPAAASSDSFLARFTPGFWSRRPATTAAAAEPAAASAAAPTAPASDISAPVAVASSSRVVTGDGAAAAAAAAAAASAASRPPGGPTSAPVPASTSAAAAAGGAAAAAPAADDRTCVVCLVGPREAGLQHGSSLHMCLCRGCAGLFKPGVPCPMCRQTIDQVISDIYM